MTSTRGLGILLAILIAGAISAPGPIGASTASAAAAGPRASAPDLLFAAAGESGPRRPEAARPTTDGRRITIPKTAAPKPSRRPDPVRTGTVPARPTAAKPAAAKPAAATPVASPQAAATPAVAAPPVATPVAATPPTPAAAAPGEPLVVRAVRFTQEGDTTRVVFDLSRGVEIDSFGLLDPFRVVVDLPEVRFDLPADTGGDAKGVVTAWRYGLFMAGRSRLVFDLSGPVAIERAAVEPATGSFGSRLVLELKRSTREAFAGHVRRAREQPVREGVGLLSKGDREAPRPQRAKAMVVIDPGHGGIDVGTRSPATGTFEKTVVLDIARLLAAKLVATGRYEVKMTRTDDSFIPLAERVAVARANHADLFLSVHADAEYDRLVRGATVYTLDDRASDGQAAALAAKENASDALAGVIPEETFDEVADILIDLTVRETKRFSHVLARHLVEGLKSVGRLVKSNPHRSANFRVLKAHDIPSALVELGFMSNKDDEQLLMSADWREKTTTALVAAVDRFFDSRMASGPN